MALVVYSPGEQPVVPKKEEGLRTQEVWSGDRQPKAQRTSPFGTIAKLLGHDTSPEQREYKRQYTARRREEMKKYQQQKYEFRHKELRRWKRKREQDFQRDAEKIGHRYKLDRDTELEDLAQQSRGSLTPEERLAADRYKKAVREFKKEGHEFERDRMKDLRSERDANLRNISRELRAPSRFVPHTKKA